MFSHTEIKPRIKLLAIAKNERKKSLREWFIASLHRSYNTRIHVTCTTNYSSESSLNKVLTYSTGLFQQLKEKYSHGSECLSVVLCNMFFLLVLLWTNFYCYREFKLTNNDVHCRRLVFHNRLNFYRRVCLALTFVLHSCGKGKGGRKEVASGRFVDWL
jgi:hypothetical protein